MNIPMPQLTKFTTGVQYYLSTIDLHLLFQYFGGLFVPFFAAGSLLMTDHPPIHQEKDTPVSSPEIPKKRKTFKLVQKEQKGISSYSLNKAFFLVAIGDILVLLATASLIYWSYVENGQSFELYLMAMILPTIMVVILFYNSGLYENDLLLNSVNQISKIVWNMVITILTFTAIVFSLKISDEFSRVWVFSWFLSSIVLIIVSRKLFSILFLNWAKRGKLSRKIVIVGAGKQAEKLIDQLKNICKKEPWLEILGIFDDRRKGRSSSSLKGYPVLGTLSDLLVFSRKKQVDDIVIALPWSADKRLFELAIKLEQLPVHVRLGSDLAGFLRLRPKFSSLGGVPMLDWASKPLDGWGAVVKEIEDKVFGLLFLILFMPFMILIALAIKIDSRGPIFFKQKRYGFNNEPFIMYKFRSMEQRINEEKGVPQAKRNDPRVTRVGNFLRQTSLDELPQLWNVLIGDMSIVGPRPHAVEHNEEYAKIIRGYFGRHRVKPGMTGWAQVNGLRGETDTTEKMMARVEHDIYYIDNWSPVFDFKILLLTVPATIFQNNAY